MRTEHATFPGASGQALAARLDLPEGEPSAGVLFAHCFACNKESHAASRVSRALAQLGFAVLRFDFTGLGSSEGDFANTDFSSNVEDLVAASAWMRGRKLAPSLLVGHSLGGAAVIAAAHRIPEARAVATIAAPSDPRHVHGLLAPALAEIEHRGYAELEIAGSRFRVGRALLEDLEEHNLLELIRSLRRALLVFHAPLDPVVGVENARTIFEAAKHPKSFVSLDEADHLLTDKADSTYVAHVLAAWAGRYLHPHVEIPLEGELAAPDRVLVEEGPEGRLAQRISVGRHGLRADEPLRLGGTDTGPTPYDLLLAALGACTSMTLRLYADRKGWPLEHVGVELHHAKIHARDCETCETESGMLDRVRRRLILEGPLDEAQRQRLREIADRCPVHRTLESEVEVITVS